MKNARRASALKIKAKFAIGLMTPLVMVLAVSIVAVTSLFDVNQSNDMVKHTYEVLNMRQRIISAAINMETGQRGFLLTGDESFLEPYHAGSKEAFEGLAKLSDGVQDNPPQVERLRRAQEILGKWQTSVAEPMIAQRRNMDGSERLQSLANSVQGKGGKAIFDSFRTQLNEFEAEERALMETRSEKVDSTANWVLITIVACGLLALCVCVAIAMYLGRNIANPIVNITASMRRLADGETDISIVGAHRSDEIGDMAAAVEVFRQNKLQADRFAASEKEQQEAREKRVRVINEMTSRFDVEVSAVLNSVEQAAASLGRTASTMSAAAKQTNDQSAVAAEKTEQASQNSTSVAAATEELTSSILEISRQIDRASQIASEAVGKSERTRDDVNSLAKASQQIGDVVSLINDLTAQTNLLALNATIEAARAGEAGRGFSVVAAEVKALAAQTANATDEITRHISGVQTATKTAVESIQSIKLTIDQIDQVSASIAAAIEEQNITAQDISKNINEAAARTASAASGMHEVNKVATVTGETAEDVLLASREMSQQATVLKSSVEQFLKGIMAA